MPPAPTSALALQNPQPSLKILADSLPALKGEGLKSFSGAGFAPSRGCKVVAGRAVVFRPAQPYLEKDVAAAVVCGLWAVGLSPARTGGGGGFTPLKKVVACTIFVRAKAH